MKCLLVSPSVASSGAAFNGNAHTAQRWAQMLESLGHSASVIASSAGLSSGALDGHDLLIALHARRSAAAIAQWRAVHPGKPSVLVLTGTDVYRDIRVDADAQHSLDVATHIVVLQPEALKELNPAHRDKSRAILQSAVGTPRRSKFEGRFTVLAVGHLREEKDPATFIQAARLSAYNKHIHWLHIGEDLDPNLLELAAKTQAQFANYRHLGAQSHEYTLQAIADADLLVHPSRMEGGAHVIAEAVACGTPVLASRISGNVGMLGSGYAGYFELGDAAALAKRACELADNTHLLTVLRQQCQALRLRFSPEAELASLQALIHDCANFQNPP